MCALLCNKYVLSMHWYSYKLLISKYDTLIFQFVISAKFMYIYLDLFQIWQSSLAIVSTECQNILCNAQSMFHIHSQCSNY